jgi:hypothetical protein
VNAGTLMAAMIGHWVEPPVQSRLAGRPLSAQSHRENLADGIQHDDWDLALGLALVISIGRPELQ